MPTNNQHSGPEHNRVCSYANSALETLLEKQRHMDHCIQCSTDPSWCNTAAEYDRTFRKEFAAWNANRSSGGVVLPKPPPG